MKGWPPREKCWACSNGTIFKYYYIRSKPLLIPEGVEIWEYDEAQQDVVADGSRLHLGSAETRLVTSNWQRRAGKRARGQMLHYALQMDHRNWITACLFGSVLLAACSNKPSQAEKDANIDLSNKTVRVVFALPGDEIGGRESQQNMEMIKDEILGKNIAKVVSSGYGMGTMEVVLKYEGAGSAEQLGQLIARIQPKAKYRIEIRKN